MKKASVTEAKNNLTAILQEVREGETYLILDRGRAVARIERVGTEERTSDVSTSNGEVCCIAGGAGFERQSWRRRRPSSRRA